MNKSLIGIITAVVLIFVIGVGAFFLFDNETKESKNTNNDNNMSETNNNNSKDEESEQDNENKEDNTTNESCKVLVVYYSATNNTKNVAEQIAKNLNGDTFEIVPVDIYTSDDLNWSNENSRVTKEHNDESLRDVKLKSTSVDNWDSYDTVLIGYPIWWGIAAWPVDTFVKANNFAGKTVIPFCTSSSSCLGESGKLLEKEAKGGNWLEGHRFSSRPSGSDIKTFTDSIK